MSTINTNLESRCADVMKEVLNWADVSYGDAGIRTHAEMYARNKGALVDLLRKHPNWNEEAMAVIIPNVSETMEVDTDNARYMLRELVSHCRKLVDHLYINPDSDHWIRREVSAELAEGVNLRKESVRANEGQKMTRMMRRYLTAHGIDLENKETSIAYQRWADAINPYSLNRTFVLSVNPGDYLTMSYGNSWSSCHIINPAISKGKNDYNGCYKAGTLSYLTDGVSMVGYTVEHLPEDLSALNRECKATRQMFMYNADNYALLQSRLYPYTNDDERRKLYRGIVQKIFATCLGMENRWTKKPENTESVYTYFETAYSSMHYKDYDNNEWSPIVSVITDYKDNMVCRAVIGCEPYCLSCGYGRCGEDPEYLTCEDCGDGRPCCANCGDHDDEEDMHLIDGEWYCEECCFYCSYHDRWETGERYYISTYDYDVCEYAYENYYVTCDACGDIVKIDDAVECSDGYFCENCSDELTQCDECGEVHWIQRMSETEEGHFVCRRCEHERVAS